MRQSALHPVTVKWAGLVPPRRGSIMIVTLCIVMILAGLVLVFSRAMRVEAMASANYVASIQANQAANAGIQYVMQLIDQQKDSIFTLDPSSFEAVGVGEGLDGRPVAYFW